MNDEQIYDVLRLVIGQFRYHRGWNNCFDIQQKINIIERLEKFMLNGFNHLTNKQKSKLVNILYNFVNIVNALDLTDIKLSETANYVLDIFSKKLRHFNI